MFGTCPIEFIFADRHNLPFSNRRTIEIRYSLPIAFQEKLKEYIIKIIFKFESNWFTGNMTFNPGNM